MEEVSGTNGNAAQRQYNVAIGDNRISVTIPFFWLKGIIATGVYFVFLWILIEDASPNLLSLSFAIPFLIFTAIWAWYVSRQKIVTVFDAFDKKVYRRNMLYCMKEIDFTDIAEIIPIRVTGMGTNLVHYKIALRENRLGKGLDLTDGYKDTHPALEYFSETALPAIQNMLAGAGAPASGAENKVSLDDIRFFAKDGPRYTRTRTGRTVFIIVAGIAVAVLGIARSEPFLSIAGVVCVLLSLLVVHTITIDTERKEFVFGRAFGKWKKTLPMERFSGMETIRTHTNGFYTGTTAKITFEDPPASYILGYSYLTRKLSLLVEECRAIIAAAGVPDRDEENTDS